MILLVGEAPGRGAGEPLAGRIGARLADMAGVSLEQLFARCARVNLLGTYPGASGKGARFDMVAARAAAERLRTGFAQYATIVLLGQRVARAFNITPTYFVPVATDDAIVVVVPHPSGVNRWYNDADNQAAMRAFMSSLVGAAE